MFIRGRIVFLLLVFISCHATQRGPRGEHVILKRAELETPPPTIVLIDTAQELRVQFIALYILFPVCLVECCICLPIGECFINAAEWAVQTLRNTKFQKIRHHSLSHAFLQFSNRKVCLSHIC